MDGNREDIIVSALTSIIAERFCECEDFNEVEGFALERTLEMLCDAFAKALQTFDHLVFAEKDPAFISKGFEKREMLTMFGTVSYRRRRYQGRDGSVYLSDEALGIRAHDKISPFLCAELARLALDQSYRAAAEAFRIYLRDTPSKMTVKRAIAQSAQALDEQVERKDRRRKVPVLDMEADGIRVALQRTKACREATGKESKKLKREVSVFSVYEGKRINKYGVKERVNTLHHASAKKAEVAWGELYEKIGQKWDTDALFWVNYAGDGDKKYTNGAKGLIDRVSCGYDLHHIVSAISPAFGVEIAREVFKTMKGAGFDAGLECLAGYTEFFFGRTNDEAYIDTFAFIASRADQIKTALVYNLGTAEGTNAHLVASRLNRFGGGWNSGLEPMVRLRAAYASGIDVPVRKRQGDYGLGICLQARALSEIEERIAKLEDKAKDIKSKRGKPCTDLPYYRQVSVAHTNSIEAGRGFLNLWS
jgi:hypothetical protein